MKIKLSKEHIEKGCELVSEYTFREQLDCISICNELESKEIADGKLISKGAHVYRDFLQLVIEAIREDHKILFSFHKDKPNHTYIAEIYSSRFRKHHVFRGCKTITEAKEKAIAHVFDNMEV